MSRLFLMVIAGVFLALPTLGASAADRQGDQDNSWKSLYSVVSHRGVKVNMVQPPPAPAPEEPAPADEEPTPGADVSPVDEADAPGAAEPEAAEPEAIDPELADPEAPAPPLDAIEAPQEAEAAPAEEESESPGDEAVEEPLLTPEQCGPVRARITDQGSPYTVPVPDDVSPMPQYQPAQQSSVVSSHGACTSSVCSSACSHGRGCGRRGHGHGGAGGVGGENPWCWCQMPQHYAYYPEMHGYYYFRPYNWTHIAEHQRITSEWGEDPRNPYGRQLFEQVYADYLAEQESEVEGPDDLGDTVVPLPPEGN